MLRLECPAMNYAWGKPADDSEVAKLARASGTDVHADKPYAELWLGTHPSGPALLAGSQTTLKDWLTAHPQALGKAVLARFGADLPFLFKVLSVQTALSIQSHPDKKLAEQLHAERPQVYKDANHKPEMALALSDFEALCGFAPHDEIVAALETYPELRTCVGEDMAAKLLLAGQDSTARKAALKQAFTALMTCADETVRPAVENLSQRLIREAAERQLSPKEQLLIRLHEQYPGDVGVLSALFLNLIHLRPGQAIALSANEPHAYLAGECVECMATSDNVIRAGLTPKLRDTEVLCSSLTYSQGLPAVLEGHQEDKHTRSYQPPFEEFQISRICLGPEESANVAASISPRILLVDGGCGRAECGLPCVSNAATMDKVDVARGGVFFLPAGVSLRLHAGEQALTMWAASCNMACLKAAAQ